MSSESLFSNISSQWTVTTLGELAKTTGGDIQTGPFGSQLHASDYVDDGVPSIMPKNISVDAVTTDDIARVSSEDVERLSKYKVQVGDIVYSRRGDVEKCARITEKEDGWLCGTGCLRVRVKPSIVSTEYLHAYLCLPTVREWIVRHAVGATMPNLNTSILSALPVIIPSNSEMTTIGSIWLTISDKIQLNRQINQTLEQIAQTIFKSWFVDFEPVKAKIAVLEAGGSKEDALLAAMQTISGKGEAALTRLQSEQPEQYAELRATAELFPSAMQDSELGELPEGWSPLPLYETAQYVNGVAFKAKDFTEGRDGLPIIKIAELKQGISQGTKFTQSNVKDKYRITNGDVLYSWSGSPETSLEVFKWFGGDGWLNQHIFKLNFTNEQSEYFTYFLLKQIKPLLVRTAQQKQTTGLGHITVADMKRIKVPYPNAKLLSAFSQLIEPLYTRSSIAVRESETLAKLRDSLLPKLLSGEFSIPDVSHQVTGSTAQFQEAN